MKLTFIGANHEVTGSCHCLEACGKKILVDYGMEQGGNVYENAELPFAIPDVDYILITHAHIDHTGLLPLLYAEGFRGQIFATQATCDLCNIMLKDSAHIQEMEAEWKNRKARRAGKPEVEPLYTVADAEQLSSGDIAVEVTVSPIEIIPLLTEDQMAAAWTSVKQASGASDEAIAAMSDEEYQVLDEQYANALLDQLETLIPQLTYGQDQVIMLQMKEEDGYYSLVDSGMQKLDEVMIDYYGAYA